MKKLFLVLSVALCSFMVQAQTNYSTNIITVTHDTIVNADTVFVVAGLTTVGMADTLNSVIISLPTGSLGVTRRTGQIYRLSFQKGITNLTYIGGSSGGNLPTAVKVQQNHSLNDAKITAEGGAFSIVYDKATKFWYRVE